MTTEVTTSFQLVQSTVNEFYYCPKCGAPVAKGGLFCHECGRVFPTDFVALHTAGAPQPANTTTASRTVALPAAAKSSHCVSGRVFGLFSTSILHISLFFPLLSYNDSYGYSGLSISFMEIMKYMETIYLPLILIGIIALGFFVNSKALIYIGDILMAAFVFVIVVSVMSVTSFDITIGIGGDLLAAGCLGIWIVTTLQ